jgi:predicted enzyme related to lactoylglutathione lyase
MGKSAVRIGSVVIDVKDFGLMREFWKKALGYEQPRPTDPGDEYAILRDPAGKGPNISIDGMEPYRNRIHLDLYAEDHDGEVVRLQKLGATVFRPREEGDDFTVLADPEGNLFCVVDASGG